MKPIIEVKNVSKKYTIGETQSYETLRDMVMEYIHKPVTWFSSPKNEEIDAKKTDFWALKNISFQVNLGDVVGIIGRNGAGKSTLLKILSRITPPTEGEIILRGRVASLLEVGTGFNAELTGRENIFLNGAILGMTQQEIRQKFDEIVDFSETGKFLDTPVKHYSSGMYMRLAFAVAAHMDPDILLVDEVLAVGDSSFQKKSLGKMDDVAKKGRTVIFVSHNMAMVRTLCTYVYLLEGGKIVDAGPTEKIIDRYMSDSTNAVVKGKKDLFTMHRPATMKKTITEAWLEDGKGAIVSDVPMGSLVRVCYAFKSERMIHNPGFGCDIYSVYGHRICSLTSYLISNKRFQEISSGTVVFTIPELTLLPGRYIISFGLAQSRTNTIDYVDMAMKFTVLPYDVFSSGTMMESGHGLVYMKSDVSVRKG